MGCVTVVGCWKSLVLTIQIRSLTMTVKSGMDKLVQIKMHNFVSFKIFIVPGLSAACESISIFVGVIEYQNPSILMQVICDVHLKVVSLSLSVTPDKGGSFI